MLEINSFLTAIWEGEQFSFNEDSAAIKGSEMRQRYVAESPFPNIVIDNFLPAVIISKIQDDFPKAKPEFEFNRNQELRKSQFNPNELPPCFAKNAFYYFNSKIFLSFLENLTGIEGLLPDPYFTGGGFHQTASGGKLGIHADFNLNRKLNVLRRINVLIYLNDDWKEEWGGQLELWDKDMKRCIKSILPIYNRCVIFNTENDSFHGQPDPINCPESTSRRSIALYYYTASPLILEEHPERTTNFRRRPKSNDKTDFVVKVKEFLKDFLPPILIRLMRRKIR